MVKKIDHVELYVANAVQAKYFYQNALGFRLIGHKVNHDNHPNNISYLLEQGDIRLILSSAPTNNHDIANHVHLHGDSVKDIVFETDNVEEYFSKAIKNGANSIESPNIIKGPNGNIKKASVSTFGNTIHSFIERSHKDGFFLPHYIQEPFHSNVHKTKLEAIDHIAIAVENDTMSKWQEFYNKVFSFRESYKQIVETKNSGMSSAVMCSNDNSTKFVFVTPLKEESKSQISNFLHYHNGAGVQHIAFSSNDIFSSVTNLKENGIEFLTIPDSYYKDLPKRVKGHAEEIHKLHEAQILLDRDDNGYLLQAFTKPVHIRPTLFFEIIQRKGSEGFGEGNVKALFEAVEKEQMQKEKNSNV